MKTLTTVEVLTIGELKEVLSRFDDSLELFMNDGGCTDKVLRITIHENAYTGKYTETAPRIIEIKEAYDDYS